MFILKKGHQPGVYVPLRALFLVVNQLPFSDIKPCRSRCSDQILQKATF